MNNRIRALTERKEKLLGAARQLSDTAEAEGRPLSEEERTQYDTHLADIDSVNADIAREQRLIEAERTAPALGYGAGARSHERREDDPRGGFRSYGEFCQAVMRAGVPGGAIDERLDMRAAPTSYGSTGSGQDGGFMVPPEFSREVFQHSLEEDALLPLTDDYPVTGNSLTFPRDETTPWGSDGIRAYWEAEAAQATQTKPKGDVATLRLNRLMALVPVTDELAADASALERYIGRKTSESIRWKTNLALFQGTGVGQPQGFFGHASAVSVAKEGSQAADTVVAANVAKMYARGLGRNRGVWMINDDVLPQVITLQIGNQPIWTPPNAGMQNAPAGLLLGRPLIVTQLCKTVGDKGDIVFANWGYYRSIMKGGRMIETATSMHLFFDYGMSAFRATFRVDGQPAIKGPVAPANGANSLSPFVTLDDRT